MTGTDVLPRALAMARLTARLNGLHWELIEGDLLGTGRGPPVRPRRVEPAVHRRPRRRRVRVPGQRSGRRRGEPPADPAGARRARRRRPVPAAGELGPPPRRVLAGPAGRLARRARLRRVGVAARGRRPGAVRGALARPTPARRAPPATSARYARWLDWFAATGVEAVGFGLVTLHKSGADRPTVRIEDVPQPIDEPAGPEVAAWFDRLDALRGVDAGHDPVRPGARPAAGADRDAGTGRLGGDRTQRLRQPAGHALDRAGRPGGGGAGRRLRRHPTAAASWPRFWSSRTGSSRTKWRRWPATFAERGFLIPTDVNRVRIVPSSEESP